MHVFSSAHGHAVRPALVLRKGSRMRSRTRFFPVAAVLALLVFPFLLGSADAQPPPVPTSSLWIYDGGAIGEVTSVAIAMHIAPFQAWAIGFSFHVDGNIAPFQLVPPCYLLGAGVFGSTNSAVQPVVLPAENALVGVPVYLQGAVSPGTQWIFTRVCTWAIAPASSRRFQLASSQKGFVAMPGDGHARVTLADGRVLVTGGRDGSQPGTLYRTQAWIYDPANTTFATAGVMTRGRGGHVMRLLADGTVLIVGGENASPPTAESYDPKTGMFAPLGSVPYALRDPVAQVVRTPGAGREYVLVAGGLALSSNTATASTMLFDAARKTFVALPDMTRPRAYAAAVTLAGNAVLITGGQDATGQAGADAELFYLGSRAFYPWGQMVRPRYGHALVALDAYRALVIGGTDGANQPKELAFFDGLLRQAFSLPWRLYFARVHFTPVRLPDGSIVVAGGLNDATVSPARTPELITAQGVSLLRPISELQTGVVLQPIPAGAVAWGAFTTHHLK